MKSNGTSTRRVALPLIVVWHFGQSSPSRMPLTAGPSLDEFLRRVFYIHFALIALREFSTVERIRRLILYSVDRGLGGFACTVFCSLSTGPFSRCRSRGVDPFVWRQAFTNKVFSTFGNPNFFGNFLVILTPITLALLLKRNVEPSGLVHAYSTLVSIRGIPPIDVRAIADSNLPWPSCICPPGVDGFYLTLVGFSFYASFDFPFWGCSFS